MNSSIPSAYLVQRVQFLNIAAKTSSPGGTSLTPSEDTPPADSGRRFALSSGIVPTE